MATIAFPIEIKVRELDGCLWTAANLVNKGHKIAIGDRSGVDTFRHIQPDFYVANDVTDSDSRNSLFPRLESCNCGIGIIDSEGGVFPSIERYFKNRVSCELLEYIDLKFMWGPNQAKLLKRKTSFPIENIFITGHPRFDLLHEDRRTIYEKSANDIQSRLGEYILVNTNFTGVNHHDSSLKKKSFREKKSNIHGIEKPQDQEEYQLLLLDCFIEAVAELSTFDEIDHVVIRPHPSESHDFYQSKFAERSGIVVESTGDVIPWIYGSKVVLHNASTTGIESAMLNTPVIAIEPETEYEKTNRSDLPNAVSKSVATVDKLLEQVQKYLNSPEKYILTAGQRNELQQYFANVDEPAAPKIAESIDAYLQEHSGTSYPSQSYTRRAKNWVKRRPIAPHIQRLRGMERDVSEYREQKFPGLSIDEVRSRLRDFDKVIDTSGMTVRRVNYLDDVYWIE